MSSNSRLRVLVTGASGFIGRALVDELCQHGYLVTAASRRPLTVSPQVNAVQLCHDYNQQDWRALFREVDHVVHCAARVHVMSDRAPDMLQAYRDANVRTTLTLAHHAAQHGVRRFIFLSTTKAVREQTAPGVPLTPHDLPTPTDPYGISKHEAEVGLLRLASNTKMAVVTIRPPLVYGPGVGANFAAIARWIARGVPLPLANLTSNRRSFVSRDNLLSLILRCLHHPAAPGRAYFVSDGEDLSTASLVRRIAGAMNRKALLFPVPSKMMRVAASLCGQAPIWVRLASSLQVDIQCTRDELGWEPPFSVDEGLRRYVISVMSQRKPNI